VRSPPVWNPEDLRDVIASFQTRLQCCDPALRRSLSRSTWATASSLISAYPRAHEDEAERSVRAGLDIVDAMEELNAAVRRPPGVELAVRIGIATGPVIRRRPDRQGNGIGNRGRRRDAETWPHALQALAQPNQIVVSAATARDARRSLRPRGSGGL